MKHMKAVPTFLTACLATFACGLTSAQEEEGQGRVQYALILPEEKTPEVVGAEENNPFEATAKSEGDSEADTEETRVRDILLQLPVVGGASGPAGRRVMLGGIRLVEGAMVPALLPDQQVALRVKSITPTAIELVWVDKKPTGLPPKVLIIPTDVSPKVRYRLPAEGGSGVMARGTIGTAEEEASATAMNPPRDQQPLTSQVASSAASNPTAPPAPPRQTPPTTKHVPEASVLRMLFGNQAPVAK